jgi:fructose-specific PTS system IIB-like component
MKFLAVTACPSGVAHTYMAAEAIEKACRERGIEVKVETQGSIGIENEITADDVKDADIVILTKDMPIKNEEKFRDLPKARIAISDAVKKADAIVGKLEATLNAKNNR